MDLAGSGLLLVRNRQHPDLLRRQPQRERSGEVLDQDRDEPFEGAIHRPMNDHRPMLVVVFPDEAQVETLRGRVVELDRAELPGPADGIGDVEVDLRTIEGAIAFLEFVRESRRLQRGTQ